MRPQVPDAVAADSPTTDAPREPFDAPVPTPDAPPLDGGCVPSGTGSVLGGCGPAVDCARSGLVCGKHVALDVTLTPL